MENAAILIVILILLTLLLSAFMAKSVRSIIAAGSALLSTILVSSIMSGTDSSDEKNDYPPVITTITTEDKLTYQIRSLNNEIIALQKTNNKLTTQLSGQQAKEQRLANANTKNEIRKTADQDSSTPSLSIYEKLKLASRKHSTFSKKLMLINESSEHNYKLKLPQNLAAKLNPKVLNEEASAAWRYKQVKGFGMLISEDVMGLYSSSKQLNEIAVGQIESVLTDFKAIKSESVETKLGTFVITHLRGKLSGRYFYYIVSSLHLNGYHYQIMSWALDKGLQNNEALAEDNRIAIQNLEQIDTNKLAPNLNKNVAKNYEDTSIGASLTAKSSWTSYDLTDEADSLPSYGATTALEDSFMLYTISVPENCTNEEIIFGYLSLFGLEDDLGENKLKTRKAGTYTVHSLVVDYEGEDRQLHSGIELIRNGNRVAILRTWGWKEDKLISGDDIWERFSWSNDSDYSNRANFSEEVISSSAILINECGLQQFDRNLLPSAIAHFKEAARLNPAHESYIRNVIYSYREMGKNQLALDLTEKTIKESNKPSKKLLSYHASILETLGKTKEAQTAYLKLFQNKHQDDDAMFNFLSILTEIKNYALAEKSSREYYANFPNIKTQRWLAYMCQNHSNFKEAESVFKDILHNVPNDASTFDGIVDLFIETKDYVNAEKYVKLWIDRIPNSMTAKMTRIDILVATNKKSEAYDYAQKLNVDHSDDNDLKLKIAKLSSSLGLGDHSLIRKKIEPVELPEFLSEKLARQSAKKAESSDRNAVCLYSINSLQVLDSGEVRETIRQKYKVLTLKGIEEHSKKIVSLYPTSQNVFINSLQVHDDSGKLNHQGKVLDYYITDVENDMATHKKSIHLPIKSLEIGSTYEITYTIQSWKYKEMMSFSDYWFVMDEPIKIRAITLTGDLSELTWKASPAIKEISLENASKIWFQENIPEYKGEGFTPDSDFLYPRLALGSSDLTWQVFLKNTMITSKIN